MARGMITVPVEAVVDFMREAQAGVPGGEFTEAMLAEAFGVSPLTIRRKLEGGMARGELMMNDYSPDGTEKLTRSNWRYGVIA